MRWKAFVTPVDHVDANTARSWIAAEDADELVLLDVRQPHEYESGHLPGAVHLPLPEVSQRAGELDPGRKTLVYCAAGMRSFAAAQFLAGKGFRSVHNLSGGMKAWEGRVAYGPPSLGLHLLPPDMPLERALAVAYGMEKGLCDFYGMLGERAHSDPARALFRELSSFEQDHADAVWRAWAATSGRDVSREAFEEEAVGPEVEGGLTGEEYLEAFHVDVDDENDVLSLAMQVEAQAMDLYARAARRAQHPEVREALERASREENGHLRRLGELLDSQGA